MDIAQLILGQIPEAIYFALFMIFAKNLKDKRIIFILIMIFEYIALTQLIQFNVWLQVIYTFMTYLNLKVFYKEKARITDICTFMIASIFLIASSALCFMFLKIDISLVTLINRIILFSLLFIFKNKLKIIENIYNKIWNRHNIPNTIKSVTFRSLFIVIFNLMFYVINSGMLFAIIYNNLK